MRKIALNIIGMVALGLGVIGIFIPLLPTTPFVLLAAWCFARSSPRFYAWLIKHPVFGPLIHNWKATGSIPLTAKALAVLALTGSFYFVWASIPLRSVQIGCSVFLGLVLIFILSRPLPPST